MTTLTSYVGRSSSSSSSGGGDENRDGERGVMERKVEVEIERWRCEEIRGGDVKR